MGEDFAEEAEHLDIHVPAPVHESESDADDIQDVPLISYKASREGLQLLRLFGVQNPHVILFTERRTAGVFLILYPPLGHFLHFVYVSRYKKLRAIRNAIVVPGCFL